MRIISKASLLALALVGASFAQQEVSPDRFEGEAVKQPVRAKHVVKHNKHEVQAKRTNKAVNRAALPSRVVVGN